MTRRRILALMVVLASAVGYPSKTSAQSADLLAVTAWRLRFTYSIDSQLQAGGQQFTYRVTASGDGLLERNVDNPTGRSFRGEPNITVSLEYVGAAIDEVGCGLEERLVGSGSPSCDNPTSLQLTSNGFELELRCQRLPVNHTFAWQGSCGELFPYPTDGEPIVDWPWLAQDVVFDAQNVRITFPYPQTGVFLAGQDSAQLTGFLAPLFTAIAMGTPTPLDYRFDFTIAPATMEDLTLEIEAPGYDRWLPSAEIPDAKGAPLGVTARLVSSTGRPPIVPISEFTWELRNTSSEPGIAMNFPVNASDDQFDMRLGEMTGGDHAIAEDGQRASLFGPSGFTDAIQVEPHDWGGWSELSVTAVLTDGRRIVGKLEGTSEDGLRLPKRSATSKIADRWKQDEGVTGQTDEADVEDKPAGDSTPGDGLTLYQEYRGFYVGDGHLRSDPKTKDFFIRNRAEGAATAGIARFTRHSGLKVHALLTEGQMPTSRVINANRRDGPSVTSQHAVIIAVRGGQSGFARAEGGPGNPKTISQVTLMGDWSTLDATYLSKVVAHELFHCVNVYHHGDLDEQVTWRDATGVLVEHGPGGPAGGTPIRVLLEDGVDVSDMILVRLQALPGKRKGVWMGVDHGQHSGFDNCVMRYNNAETYMSRTVADVRYYVSEDMGAALCDTPDGTGPNAASWTPQSRYEGASSMRGTCESQMLVTDAVSAPGR